MSIVQISDEGSLDSVLKGRSPVLLDFWRPECAKCRLMKPVLEGLAAERAGSLTVVTVNVDEFPAAMAAHSVSTLPTLKLFRAGQEVSTMTGAVPKTILDRELDAVLGLGEASAS